MLGFGKGRIVLELPRLAFAPGETIEGTLTLDLKKPVKARGVRVALVAERDETRRVVDTRGGFRTERRTVQLHEFRQDLAPEGEYGAAGPQAFRFTLPVPAAPPGGAPEPAGGEGLGGVLRGALDLLGPQRGPTRWFVRGRLDVPWGLDVTAQTQVAVQGPPPGRA